MRLHEFIFMLKPSLDIKVRIETLDILTKDIRIAMNLRSQ
jgi:hypothetical protein